MDWHWTWQDPVAIGLALLGIAFAWWLRRKTASKVGGGCPTCAPNPVAITPAGPEAKRVATSQLRLSQRGER